MPISTTTLAAIIDKIAGSTSLVGILPGIVPAKLSDSPFARSPTDIPLREWARGRGSEVFRKFEIPLERGRRTPGAIASEASYIHRQIRLTIAYPAHLRSMAGAGELDDLQDLVESDVNQIWQAIWSPGNLIDGCNAMQVNDDEVLDRSDPKVWFLDFLIDVHFYQAHTFT